jgi:DNA-binding response OmpR family regulator
MGQVALCDAQSPFREAIERALEASGHKVRTAKDLPGLHALLRGAETTRMDCVLLDEAAVAGCTLPRSACGAPGLP